MKRITLLRLVVSIHHSTIVTILECGLFYAAVCAQSLLAQTAAFHPGTLWFDDHHVAINAHGAGILSYKGTYYWFGEHKIAGSAGNLAHVGVHVYSSKIFTIGVTKELRSKYPPIPQAKLPKAASLNAQR